MTKAWEKRVPVWCAGAAGALYIVKHLAGISFLYYPLLALVALAIGSVARAVGARLLPGLCARFGSRRTVAAVLAAVVTIFFAVFTVLAICKYDAFSLRMFDFGLMDQAIWNTAHGRLLEVTDPLFPFHNESRLSTHVEAIYGVFAALYRIDPDPRLLFAGQTLFVCAGVVLLFLIARIVLGHSRTALAVACAAALFPSLQFMTLFDFHGDVLSIPFFLLSYVGYLKRKYWLFWLGLALALLCKEYAGLAAAGYGCALMAAHRDWKRGAATFTLGLFYFVISFYCVVPLFNDGSESTLAMLDYGAIDGAGGLSGMGRYALAHPMAFLATAATAQNAESLFYLFFPLVFLPLLSPAFLLGAAPIFVKDMLYGMDIGTHHLACGLPFIFISFVYGIRRCGEITAHTRFERPLFAAGFPMVTVIAAGLVATFCYGPSPAGHRFWREAHLYRISPHARECAKVIARIPPLVPVSVSDNLAPHLTHRRHCYVFPAPFAANGVSELCKTEYVCVDTSLRQSLAPGDTGFAGQTFPLIRSQGFDVITSSGPVFLFKRRLKPETESIFPVPGAS